MPSCRECFIQIVIDKALGEGDPQEANELRKETCASCIQLERNDIEINRITNRLFNPHLTNPSP